MDTGYRIGYKFFQSGYMIPDWIHKIFQNLESNSKIKFSDYRSIIPSFINEESEEKTKNNKITA
eukprot:UN08985